MSLCQIPTHAASENGPTRTPRDSAIAIIKQEHRSIGYLLHTLQQILQAAAVQRLEVDFKLIANMLYYIDSFADLCHHPKEEEHLFKRLRGRTNKADALLDELEGQHLTGARMMICLEQAFVHWQGGATNGLAPFSEAVRAYAELLWGHMEQEENLMLAFAREYLDEDDWRAIDEAFRANDDPLFGLQVRDEFARLKTQIITQLPRKLKARQHD